MMSVSTFSSISGAARARRLPVVVHRDAHRAARVAPFEARIGEDGVGRLPNRDIAIKQRSWTCYADPNTDAFTHLTNPALIHILSAMTMNLVAEWQTWMNMHGAPGHILFKGEGDDIASVAEAPDDYRIALADKFPGQLEKARLW